MTADERAEAAAVLRSDPVMADLLERYDPYEAHGRRPFERLCVSIVGQQLSTASAAAVRERAFETLGEVTPAGVLAADEAALREAGLSASKVDYLQNAARAFRDDDLTPAGLADRSDEAVVDRLTEVRGVGRWTAEMYLIFVLGRPDVLPLGDLAVRRGIETLYGDGDDGMSRAEMREVADAWRPYRSHATRYIWADYESE